MHFMENGYTLVRQEGDSAADFANTFETFKEKTKMHSKPVARHFDLPNHSHKYMALCGISQHHGNTESARNYEQNFLFQIGTLNPHEINERFSFD